MKRLIVLGLLVAGTLAGGFHLVRTEDEPTRPEQAASARERLARVTQVNGQPVKEVTVDGQRTKAVAGEVLVKTADPAALRARGERIEPTGLPQTYKLLVDQSVDPAAAAAHARTLPGVTAAGPNYVVTATLTPNDPLYSQQYALPKMAVPTAWDRTTGSASIKIASIDTGVNHNHEDLTGRDWVNTAETPGNSLDDDNNGYVDDYRGMDFVHATFVAGKYVNDADSAMDDHGHGSTTASVFAAKPNNSLGIAGLDWQAKFVPIKVLDDNGNGSFDDVAAGIRYASIVGAKVQNLSLGAFGVTSDFATDEAIGFAYGRGGIIVAASGNDGSSNTIDYPANNPKVIAVGSTDSNDVRSGFSNGGPQLSVVAPGSSIRGVRAVLPYPWIFDHNPETDPSSTLAPGYYDYAVTAYNAIGETVGDWETVTVASGQRVRLTWNSVSGASGYRVYRSPVYTSEADYQTPKRLADVGNQTSYNDTGAAPLGSTPVPMTNTAVINNDYRSASGTSLAAPQVAGIAGLVAGLNPVSPATFRSMIQNGTDKVAGMGGANRTDLYGYGRVNAQKVLDQLPAYSAAWAGQSAYPTVAAGDQTTVYIDYKNTGSATWTDSGPNPVRLGTTRPNDRASRVYSPGWISPNRVGTIALKVNGDGSATPATAIAPGETTRFQFTVTGPPVDGQQTFREYFRPVAEAITWMEDQGVFLDVTSQPRTFSYSWAGQTYPPAVMTPGSRHAVTIDLTNTGTGKWNKTTTAGFRLGTARPRDRGSVFANDTWHGNTRLELDGRVEAGSLVATDVVNPGQTARFSFDFVAPSTPGSYREYFEPLLETYRWLGDIGIFWETYVPGADYDYQWITQSAYPSMKIDETAPVTLRLRNVGRLNWTSNGTNPVRLGTERPRDRQSGFSNNGSGAGWINPSRVKLTRNITDPSQDYGGETTIRPGDIAEFEFTVTGKPEPGSYNEYFAPVVEGLQWMPDRGIFWTMSVQKPIRVGLAQQATVTANSDGPVNFVDSIGTVLATVPTGQDVTLTWNGVQYYGIWPGGSVSSINPIKAVQGPHNIFDVQNMGDNGAFDRFRGNLIISNGAAGSWLVNDINLEEYLRGLGEVPDSWPIESIKAQIVAARTFAARRLQNPRNGQFDIYDTVSDQVYNGYNNEVAKPNHITAINATKGIAIFKNGSLIQAFYSSDTGGHTDSNENVWGGSPIDYLRPVSDPYHRPDIWSKTVSNATIRSAYSFPGTNIDTITVTEAYPSGRIKTIRLSQTGGVTQDHTLPADTHRSRLTLRSSLVTAIGRSGNDYVFDGRGFGHGIGMGQWGAYNQANAGRSYQQILQFYYTGVGFQSIY